ncbi:MAG: hypothetical protein UZ16_OP3001003002 [Candidatus Hinthialibacteria bacterium OLB16]|nr:MAG: hypothetical protein UZ16_OP3001003002 [Candidatus Hinthialibacteria bacterium OLB16]
MAEQLAFKQVLIESAAVDLDEGLVTACAEAVNGFGDQLLAGAAFTTDQNSRTGGSDLAHLLKEAVHRFGKADQLPESIFFLKAGAEVFVFRKEVAVIQDSANHQLELIEVDRLLEIIDRPQAHALRPPSRSCHAR